MVMCALALVAADCSEARCFLILPAFPTKVVLFWRYRSASPSPSPPPKSGAPRQQLEHQRLRQRLGWWDGGDIQLGHPPTTSHRGNNVSLPLADLTAGGDHEVTRTRLPASQSHNVPHHAAIACRQRRFTRLDTSTSNTINGSVFTGSATTAY